jgi:hypothetical protein
MNNPVFSPYIKKEVDDKSLFDEVKKAFDEWDIKWAAELGLENKEKNKNSNEIPLLPKEELKGEIEDYIKDWFDDPNIIEAYDYKYDAGIIFPKEEYDPYSLYRPFESTTIPTTLIECAKYALKNKLNPLYENYAMDISENILNENGIKTIFKKNYKFYCKKCNENIPKSKLLFCINDDKFKCYKCNSINISKKTIIEI